MRKITMIVAMFFGFAGSAFAGGCNTFSLGLSTDGPLCSQTKYKLYLPAINQEVRFVPTLKDIEVSDAVSNAEFAKQNQVPGYYYEGILLTNEVVWSSALAARAIAH